MYVAVQLLMCELIESSVATAEGAPSSSSFSPLFSFILRLREREILRFIEMER